MGRRRQEHRIKKKNKGLKIIKMEEKCVEMKIYRRNLIDQINI